MRAKSVAEATLRPVRPTCGSIAHDARATQIHRLNERRDETERDPRSILCVVLLREERCNRDNGTNAPSKAVIEKIALLRVSPNTIRQLPVAVRRHGFTPVSRQGRQRPKEQPE